MIALLKLLKRYEFTIRSMEGVPERIRSQVSPPSEEAFIHIT